MVPHKFKDCFSYFGEKNATAIFCWGCTESIDSVGWYRHFNSLILLIHEYGLFSISAIFNFFQRHSFQCIDL